MLFRSDEVERQMEEDHRQSVIRKEYHSSRQTGPPEYHVVSAAGCGSLGEVECLAERFGLAETSSHPADRLSVECEIKRGQEISPAKPTKIKVDE